MLENRERRKEREQEAVVWDRLVRTGHWLLAFSFATAYLEYKRFPLHTFAGYLMLLVITVRIIWGFIGSPAARFSAFAFSPRNMLIYFREALGGHASYHFSHNPMGAAMVYALLILIPVNCILGIVTYSASQQLGPLGSLVPEDWEDLLVRCHQVLGHLTAALVCAHLFGVVWAAWIHRENYLIAMFSGKRRIPRNRQLPEGVSMVPPVSGKHGLGKRAYRWLGYRRPVLGTLILMGLIVLVAVPLIAWLVTLNRDWLAL